MKIRSIPHLIDPITGRRYLPEGHIWIGNEHNVEDFANLETLIFNCRDLRARLYLLSQIVAYICNSRIIVPTKIKYLTNAQAIDEIETNSILKHKNGVLKKAIPGEDYVDYQQISDGKFCVSYPTINETSNKFIDVSDISPKDIKDHWDEYERFKLEIKNEFEIKLKGVVELVNNINTLITTLPNITVNNQTINNIGDTINQVQQTINNITEQIRNIIEKINNNNYDFDLQQTLENFRLQINNILRIVNNLKASLDINLPDNYFDMFNEYITKLGDLITNIKNNFNIDFNINPELAVDLQNILNVLVTMFADLLVLLNMMFFVVIPFLTTAVSSGEDTCIAWALANDQLNISWNEDYGADFSAGHIYHNLPMWGEKQFFSFSERFNHRLVIKSVQNIRSEDNTQGLQLIDSMFNGWFFRSSNNETTKRLEIGCVSNNIEQSPVLVFDKDYKQVTYQDIEQIKQDIQQTIGNVTNEITNEIQTIKTSKSLTVLPEKFLPPTYFRVKQLGWADVSWDAIGCNDAGQFVLCSSNTRNLIAFSNDDGNTWELKTFDALQGGYCLVCALSNSWLVLFRRSVLYAVISGTDIATGKVSYYRLPNASCAYDFQNVCYDPIHKIVRTVSDNVVFSSLDEGITWTTFTLSSFVYNLSQPSFCACNPRNGRFVVVQQSNNYFYNAKYNPAPSNTSSNHFDIATSTLYSLYAMSSYWNDFSGITITSTGDFYFNKKQADDWFTPFGLLDNGSSFYAALGTYYRSREPISFSHYYSQATFYASTTAFNPCKPNIVVLENTVFKSHAFPFEGSSFSQDDMIAELKTLNPNWNYITGGYGRTYAWSTKTGTTIVLTNTNAFIYC